MGANTKLVEQLIILEQSSKSAESFMNRYSSWARVATANHGDVLLVHGQEDGSLAISDETLDRLLPELRKIVCCYPAQVGQWYGRLFPGIEEKLFFPEHDRSVQLEVTSQWSIELSISN